MTREELAVLNEARIAVAEHDELRNRLFRQDQEVRRLHKAMADAKALLHWMTTTSAFGQPINQAVQDKASAALKTLDVCR